MKVWRGTAGQGTQVVPLPSRHTASTPPAPLLQHLLAPDVPAVCAVSSAMTLAAPSSILGAQDGAPIPWEAFSICPSNLCFPCCPPSIPTARSLKAFPNGLYQEGAGQGNSRGRGTPGICPWSAPACLEPPKRLRLFLLSPWSIVLCSPGQGSPAPQQSWLFPGEPHHRQGARAGSAGLSSRRKGRR